MSCVKLHLPWYDTDILLDIVNVMSRYKDVKVIDIDEIKSKNPKNRYNKICQNIFKNYAYRVILIGNFSVYPLPIPRYTKFISTGIRINPQDGEKYVEYGYQIVQKNIISELIANSICSSSIATFGGFKLDSKEYLGDTYHLWYLSKFNKVYKIKRQELIQKAFQVKNEKDFEIEMLWENTTQKKTRYITYENLKQYKGNYNRVRKAKLDYPIQIYKVRNKYHILDGIHRTARAYQNKVPYLMVQFVDKKTLKMSSISLDEILMLGQHCQKKFE